MYNPGVEVFLAIARTQSLSKAADQLNLAQSTVSKRLKVLEQELGNDLIERGKGIKSIKLTPIGESFIDLAERWDSLWQEAQTLCMSDAKMTLTIGSLDSLNYSLFPSIYRILHSQYPRVSLKVLTTHSPDMYSAVECKQIDVGFSLIERVHPSVNVEKCFAEPMVVLRMADAAASLTKAYHPDDLDPNHELYVRWSPFYQLWHDLHWKTKAPGRIYIDTWQLIVSCMQDKDDWAIVPLSVAKTAQKKGTFSIGFLSVEPPIRTCYKLTHKYPKSSTAKSLAVFDECLEQVFNTEFSYLKDLLPSSEDV